MTVKVLCVSDFMWSLSNDHVLSCSLDGTSRLWEVASGKSIRCIADQSGAEVLTCCFQPLNNNFFLVSLRIEEGGVHTELLAASMCS